MFVKDQKLLEQFKDALLAAVDIFNYMTEERQIEAIKLLCQLVSDVQSSFKQKAVKKQLASEAFLTVTSLAEGLIQEVYGLADKQDCSGGIGLDHSEFCLTSFDQLHSEIEGTLEEEEPLTNYFDLGDTFSDNFLIPLVDGYDSQINEESAKEIEQNCSDLLPREELSGGGDGDTTNGAIFDGQTSEPVDNESKEVEPQPSYKCQLCNFSTKHRQNLTRHKQRNHPKGEVPKFMCEICQKEVKSLWSLHEHKQYVHNKPVRNFKCELCGKSYVARKDLHRHEKTHDNKRAYKCDQCEKAYNFLFHLKRHKTSAHLKESAKVPR